MSKAVSKVSNKTCCVYGCMQTKRTSPDSPFFSLPAVEDRRNEWLKIIGRLDLKSRADLKPKSYSVCALHFEECMLKSLRYLEPDAVPCRFLPDVTENDTNQAHILQIANSSIDWDEIILNPPEVGPTEVPISQSPVKKDKHDTIIVPTNHTTLIIPGLQDNFSRNFCKLIEEKVKIHKEKDQYRKEFMFYALNMYILNPQAYCFISDALNLPNEKAVKRIKLKLTPKLDNRVLDCLSSKLKSLPEKAKYCTVCLDAILLKSSLYYDTLNDELIGFQNIDGNKIKECAGYAYVMMLRGILVKWDQPVAYCFLTNPKNYHQLDSWINGVITELFKVGFEVLALVSNQGSNLKKLAKDIMDISPKKTFFKVNGRKIYYIFEVPQLLKCLRNNLLSKNIYYANSKKMSWEYIELLHSLENEKKHKIAPKLTSGHMRPTNFQKMSVTYAAEVFSTTVSNAIHTYVDMEKMPEESRQSADFCLFLNDLYDVLNSRTYKSDNIYKCALGTHEAQMKLIEDALIIFSTMVCKSLGKNARTRVVTTLPSIQVSLRSIVSLAKDLNNLGHKHILTERLNQDPLDNFMDLARRMVSKTNDLAKPTPIQFCRNFSKLFIKYALTKSPLSNRPSAFEKFFDNASQLRMDRLEPIPSKKSRVSLNGETDYQITLPDDYPTIYIASYLFYKCEQVHGCVKLKAFTKTLPDLAKTQAYNVYNQKAAFYGKLRLLNLPFIQYIEELDKAIIQYFQRALCTQLGAALFNVLKDIPFSPPCKCFPTSHLIKVLIRLRIYATIKKFNSDLKKHKTSGICEFLLNLLPE